MVKLCRRSRRPCDGRHGCLRPVRRRCAKVTIVSVNERGVPAMPSGGGGRVDGSLAASRPPVAVGMRIAAHPPRAPLPGGSRTRWPAMKGLWLIASSSPELRLAQSTPSLTSIWLRSLYFWRRCTQGSCRFLRSGHQGPTSVAVRVRNRPAVPRWRLSLCLRPK